MVEALTTTMETRSGGSPTTLTARSTGIPTTSRSEGRALPPSTKPTSITIRTGTSRTAGVLQAGVLQACVLRACMLRAGGCPRVDPPTDGRVTSTTKRVLVAVSVVAAITAVVPRASDHLRVCPTAHLDSSRAILRWSMLLSQLPLILG